MKFSTTNYLKAATLLKQGAIGIIPTDTVYGIVACLDDEAAVKRLLLIKGRNTKPIGTVLAGTVRQLQPFIDKQLLDTAQNYWPGPVSVVLPLGSQFGYAHKNLNSLPFRIPNSRELQTLATTAGLIATTSANLPGDQPVTTIQDAMTLFGDSVDFYVDGGVLKNKKPSKIIKIHDNKGIEVIREG